ncbi:MAG: amidohydrolase family protein [Ectothiorhodospiraceae bacterium]
MIATSKFRSISVALCLLTLSMPAVSREVADRIWHGGVVLTMNDEAMTAQAVAASNGRILAVGTEAAVMAYRGEETEVVDLQGRALLPGFVDSHGHVVFGGLQALSANLLAPPDGEVSDIASLQRVLKAWMAANDKAVREAGVIVGFGYDNAQLAELRHPTRDDLDAVSTEFPIYLIHQSGHLGAVNSRALEVAGVTADSPDPAGGVIRRRQGSREPNGVLEETALFPVLVKLFEKIGPVGLEAFVRAGVRQWASFGYTTVQEGRTAPPVVDVMRKVAAEGGFAVDVAVYSDVLVDRDYIKRNASREYTDRLRIAGAKLTIDGSPQGFTAWRDRPYYDPVGDYPPGYSGYPSATEEQVIEAIDWAFANDVQILTHANGERASDLLIAAIDAATRKHGRADRRPVLIHGQFLREDQVDALQRLDVFPSLFPMHTFYWGDWHREHTVGPVLAENISPTGWVRLRGMRFGTHHDAPVAFPDSMRVLDATVTRRSRSGDIIGPAQRVDVITALKAMTLWPAYQHFEEDRKGSIEVGKLADFVILSEDPTAVDPETLDRLKVLETIKEGVVIYPANGENQQRHALTWRPASGGNDAFARFLVAAASNHETLVRPQGRHSSPGSALPDRSCVAEVLAEWALAMTGGTYRRH